MGLFDRVTLLSGGIGGARFLDGLSRALPASSLKAVVNIGDDFEHLDLAISPDLDTCLYTLSGLSDEARGWGLRDESFRALERLGELGEDTFFMLGDLDLATHLARTRRLKAGERLTEISLDFARRLGVDIPLLPASDEPLRTIMRTKERGEESFQDWLVRHQAAGTLESVEYRGDARPTPETLEAIDSATLILIAPSNPYVSIAPILELGDLRERIKNKPCVAISPLIGGEAVKGPLASMIPALSGAPPSARAIAELYHPLLDLFIVHNGDREGVDVRTAECDILMRDRDDRLRLARDVLRLTQEALAS